MTRRIQSREAGNALMRKPAQIARMYSSCQSGTLSTSTRSSCVGECQSGISWIDAVGQ